MSDFLNPHVSRPAIRWVSGDALPAIEQTGQAAPLLIDSTTGRLLVDATGGGGGGGSTDMGPTNAKLDTLIGIETTEAADIALTKAGAVSIDNKLPSLSSGMVPVEANNAASQVYNYTATGAVSSGTVLIDPIDCSQFREISVQCVALGTAGQWRAEISNNSTTWTGTHQLNTSGTVNQTASISSLGLINFSTLGARFFRVVQSAAQTSGTTTLVAYASQQATPKLYQSVAVTGVPQFTPAPSASNGFSGYHTLVSAASTNATSVRGQTATIGSLILTNSSATWAYFKLVNKVSAPTVGTDTAIINIGVAPNTTLNCSTSFAGLRMFSGIAYYISGGPSLTDNTALPAAGTFLVNMTYA